jgi:serine/threonine protein kinase
MELQGIIRAMSDTVQTVADFLRVVRKSGLVDEERLAKAVEPWTVASAALPESLVQALIDGELLTQWQVDQLRKGRHKGFILGKYRLLRLLGTGGMSSVYLAEHTTLHSKVAIKVLPVKRVDQTSYLARFEREAQQSARLNHPNIIRTFDLDTSGTIHFIAMEYVEGVDLHAKVKQGGPLDVREAADYVRQAALGLHHAHEEGLVHRDIKPANLILDKRGTVKILDLGLALAGGDSEEESLTREHDEKVLGTADYLAPEQARDSHLADRRSDIYSLGCTLFYLLVGRAPFAKGSLAERIQAHMKKPPPNLLDERADVPPAIAELYFRMLEKHPDARPQSAREIADSLAAWLAATADAVPRGRPEPPRRAPPRRSPSGTADPGSSNVHTAMPQFPAGYSGPGSSSGGFPAVRPGGGGSGIGSGSLSFTPPPSGGTRATATLAQPPRQSAGPAAAAPPPATDPLIQIDVAARPGPAPARSGSQPTKQAVKKPLEFAGLPLGFWIAAGIGVLVAIGLAVKLFVFK